MGGVDDNPGTEYPATVGIHLYQAPGLRSIDTVRQ